MESFGYEYRTTRLFFLLEKALIAEVFESMCPFHLSQGFSTRVAFGQENDWLWGVPCVIGYLAISWDKTNISSDILPKVGREPLI